MAFDKTLPKQLFINNQYVDSKSDKKLTVHDPVTGDLVANDVPCAGEADVEDAVAAAAKAFPGWRKTSTAARQNILLKFGKLIEENSERLGFLNDATFRGLGAREVALATTDIKYNVGWIDKLPGESWPIENGGMTVVQWEPYGITAGITPWNAPIFMAIRKAIPALVTGNVFILKPSEKTPFASLAFGQLIAEAGFPPGVFQVLSGDGSTGALLSSHMKIRKISFTGSVATGKRIQVAAAQSNLKAVTLELGGKSPSIVFDDADLEKAVKVSIAGLLTNNGQICIALSRVYVQEGIYDKFVAAYKKALESWPQLGPLVDKIQYDRVSGFLNRAVDEKQGTVVTGGPPTDANAKGYFIKPTTFTDVKPDAEILKNEIFGPVSCIVRFKTEEEAIALSNDTEFGLYGWVFTADVGRGIRVASELETARVGINEAAGYGRTFAPVTGFKQSGQGYEAGLAGTQAWMERKQIIIGV